MEYFFPLFFSWTKSCCSITGFLASNENKVKRKLNIAPFPWQHYLNVPNIINVKIPWSEITAVFLVSGGVLFPCLPHLTVIGMGNHQGQVLLSGDFVESRGRTSSSEQGQGSERSSARWVLWWACFGSVTCMNSCPRGKGLRIWSVQSCQSTFQGESWGLGL